MDCTYTCLAQDTAASSAFHMVAEHSGVPGVTSDLRLARAPCPRLCRDLRLQEVLQVRVLGVQDVPAPVLTPQEEFDLFGPPDGQNPLRKAF